MRGAYLQVYLQVYLQISMRNLLCLPVFLFSACSVIPPQAWTFDPTQPQSKPTLAVAEVVALTDRTAQLQLERNDIRKRISNETDARGRLGYTSVCIASAWNYRLWSGGWKAWLRRVRGGKGPVLHACGAVLQPRDFTALRFCLWRIAVPR